MRTLGARSLPILLSIAIACGLAVVAVVVAPAEATNATCTTSPRWVATHKTWGVPKRMKQTWGHHFYFAVEVDGQCVGNTDPVQGTIWAGSTQLQVSAGRGRPWRTVHTEEGPRARWEGKWKIRKPVRVRIRFTGGVSYANDTWKPSTSSVIRVKVRRKARMSTTTAAGYVRAAVRAAPRRSIRGLRVAVQVKRSGTWRTVQRPIASRRGVAVARLPRSAARLPLRAVLPADRGMTRSVVRP